MSTLIRWNPMREMLRVQRDLDRLIDSAFQGEGSWTSTALGLPLDVAETGDAFVVTAAVPGLNPEDIDITFAENVLTIKGEFKMEETDEEVKFHLRERRFGSFARSISLPTQVNSDAIEASYNNGILTLTVPKAEQVKPRQIKVNVANGSHRVLEG